MIEYITLIIGAISPLIGAIGAYVVVKRYINKDTIMDMIEDFSEEIATNKDLQQKIFIAGSILGQGVKGGLGLTSQGKGKFKMEDIIGMAVQQFLPNILGKLGGTPQDGQTAPTEANPQQVNPYG